MISQLRRIWLAFMHTFSKRETYNYPEKKMPLAARYRGRIVLTRDPDGMERCVACYLCEEACPTYAIQLTPDYEICEYDRQNLVFEKEHLTISGQGKQHGYNFYRIAGIAIDGKDKGEGENEKPPEDRYSLIP